MNDLQEKFDVHLDWYFVKKEGHPKESGKYLCLVYTEDHSGVELLMLDFHTISGLEWFEDPTDNTIFADSAVIAWADKNRVLFECDPEKNDICNKSYCWQGGGECSYTSNINFAVGFDEE